MGFKSRSNWRTGICFSTCKCPLCRPISEFFKKPEKFQANGSTKKTRRLKSLLKRKNLATNAKKV